MIAVYRRQVQAHLPPVSKWPAREARHFLSDGKLKRNGRLSMCVFLFGNGVDPRSIASFVKSRCDNRDARAHVDSILVDLEKDKYPAWYYFDHSHEATLRLDGAYHRVAFDVRVRNTWDRFVYFHRNVHRSWPTLAMRDAFARDPCKLLSDFHALALWERAYA